MNRSFVVLGSVAIGFPLMINSALSCQCVESKSVAASVESSAAVFSGRVSKIYGTRVTFAVDRSWKGRNEPELIVYTAAESMQCGYPFENGDNYLVYAYSEGDDRLGTNSCTRTRKLTDAQEDLDALGNGTSVSNTEGKPK